MADGTTGAKAPFTRGDRVNVPGRFKCLIVSACWQGRDVVRERVDGMTVKTTFPGDWYVRAEFESGFGWYEGRAHEFSSDDMSTPRATCVGVLSGLRNRHNDCDCSACLPPTY